MNDENGQELSLYNTATSSFYLMAATGAYTGFGSQGSAYHGAGTTNRVSAGVNDLTLVPSTARAYRTI